MRTEQMRAKKNKQKSFSAHLACQPGPRQTVLPLCAPFHHVPQLHRALVASKRVLLIDVQHPGFKIRDTTNAVFMHTHTAAMQIKMKATTTTTTKLAKHEEQRIKEKEKSHREFAA